MGKTSGGNEHGRDLGDSLSQTSLLRRAQEQNTRLEKAPFVVEAWGRGEVATAGKEQSLAQDASPLSPLQNKSLKLLRKERAALRAWGEDPEQPGEENRKQKTKNKNPPCIRGGERQKKKCV